MKDKKIHFIGIGGVSMSGLALYCKNMGAVVSGSDIHKSKLLEKLNINGIKVFYKHSYKNLKNVDIVVYTDAISNNNSELIYAFKKDLKVFKRAEFLAEISKNFEKVIAVAGCHGKTTTTGLLNFALNEFCPTTHIGGIIENKNFFMGDNKIFITEACEYKKNLLHIKPDVAIILNIGKDHMDCYKNLLDIKLTFQNFTNNLKEQGVVIINGDDKICEQIKCKNKLTFGLRKQNDFYATNIKESLNAVSFDYYIFGEFVKNIKINIGLKHNVYNALATLASCYVLNSKFCLENIQKFRGVKRRNEFINLHNYKTQVFHDYAHHPKEILKIINEHKKFCKGRLFVVFEAHTFTRTKALLCDFKKCFKKADVVYVLPIYPAREKPIKGVTGKMLAKEINAVYVSGYKKCAKIIKQDVGFNDKVLILGAGNVYLLADMFK